jgi:hypothetical protein
MLLFPEPLGPEIDTRPGSNRIVVFLNPNDLKPKISTFFTCTNRDHCQFVRIIDV